MRSGPWSWMHAVSALVLACGMSGCTRETNIHGPATPYGLLPDEEYRHHMSAYAQLHEELRSRDPATWTSHDWERLYPYLGSTDWRIRIRTVQTILEAQRSTALDTGDLTGQQDDLAVASFIDGSVAVADHMAEQNAMLSDESYERALTVQRLLHSELKSKRSLTVDDWERLCRGLYSSDWRLRTRAMTILVHARGPSFHRYEHLIIPFVSDEFGGIRILALGLLASHGSPATKRLVANWRHSRDGFEVEAVEHLPHPQPEEGLFTKPTTLPPPRLP